METQPAGTTPPVAPMQRIKELQAFMQEWMVPDVDFGVIPGKGTKPSLFKPGAQKLMAQYNLASQIKNVKQTVNGSAVEYEVTVSLLNKLSGMLEGEGVGWCSTGERKYIKADSAEVTNTVLKMSKKRALIDAVLDATGASVLFTQDVEDMDDSAFGGNRNTPTQTLQPVQRSTPRPAPTASAAPQQATASDGFVLPSCKKCGGEVWDNRLDKKNPKAPDFKCKDKTCVDDRGYGTAMWLKDIAKDADPMRGSIGEIEAKARTATAQAEGDEGFANAVAKDEDVATQAQIDDYNNLVDYLKELKGPTYSYLAPGTSASTAARNLAAIEAKITEFEGNA